jgi:hypothetical protein
MNQHSNPKTSSIGKSYLLSRMSHQFENKLLNFIESGFVKGDQMCRFYDSETKGEVFGTANEISSTPNKLGSW